MQASQEPASEREDVVVEEEANEELAFMTQDNPEEAEPKKKRYYRPNEVMKKKGCIGCGGMAFAILVGAFAVVVASVLS